MTLADTRVCAFVAAADSERAKAFYSTVLGLRLRKDDGFALIYDAGGTSLRIQKAGTFTPQRFTVLGWEVDIEQKVDELTARGVEFLRVDGLSQDARGIWDAGGDRVCWFHDPDGNTLSLHHSASRGSNQST